jgi:Domain of unknown function (DUF1876)
VSKNKNRPGFDVRIIGDRNATAASVAVRVPWPDVRLLEVQAAGTAKREAGDRHEPETGAALALARALRNVAGELEQLARQRVVYVEKQALREHGRRELQRAMRAMPKPGMRTADIRAEYGDEAAELHKARRAARKARKGRNTS